MSQFASIDPLTRYGAGDIVGSLALQHTFSHVDCPACEETLRNSMGHDADSLLHLLLPDAAAKWLPTRKPYLKPDTYYMYCHHAEQLGKFFSKLTVNKIHLGHLREYQQMRLVNASGLWQRKAGPSLINHELSVMQQILKRAGTWKRFGDHYEPLPLPAFRPKRVMTDEEEDLLFSLASRNPNYELAYWATSITNQTTAAGTELRHIRLEHIFLDATPPRILVDAETAKNGYRGRVIALNETAKMQIERCVARAKSLGSFAPHHYLFPLRVKTSLWDPTKPTSKSWLAKQFKAMREEAGMPWLTPHSFRHQCITRLLEFGVPSETVRNVAGHVSETMMRHYSHTRISIQGHALDQIDPLRRKRSEVPRLGTMRKRA